MGNHLFDEAMSYDRLKMTDLHFEDYNLIATKPQGPFKAYLNLT